MNLDNQDYKEYVKGQLRDRSPGEEIAELKNLEIESIYIAKKAKEFYRMKHKVDGIKGMHDTIRELIKKGHLLREDDGTIVLFGEGYRIVMNPEGTSALSYKCIHRERSLPDKRKGVKSRFHKSRVNPKKLPDRLTDENIDLLIIPKEAVLSLADELGYELEETRDMIRDDIATTMEQLEDAIALNKAELSFDSKSGLDYEVIPGYLYLANGAHKFIYTDYEVTLRPDALRVKEISLTNIE